VKAVLFKNRIEFPPVHDLVRLAKLLRDSGISPPCSEDELRKLNPYAVMYRYDDREIGTLTREEAWGIVETVRHWAGETVEKQ